MKKVLLIILLLSLSVMTYAEIKGKLKVRIKDVTRIKGFERNRLIGYGIVVGLNGTGDSKKELIQHTLANLLRNFKIDVSEANLITDNAAAVMVTAELKSAGYKGETVDVTVSTMADCESLLGGQLLMTPLLGGDGKIYSIAQGSVITGGFSFGNSGAGGDKKVKNHPTVGTVTNGAKMTQDLGVVKLSTDVLTFLLSKPDFTSAIHIAEAINTKFIGSAIAAAKGLVKVRVPQKYRDENNLNKFISEVQQLQFAPDREARIVINERTGTIIIGGDVKISEVAISHGNITVDIKRFEEVSQPTAPFSDSGTTVVTNKDILTVTEPPVHFKRIKPITTVKELVDVLNKLGVSPRDMISIFQAMRESGALHAKLESM